MYRPDYTRIDDPKLLTEVVQRHPFATLVTTTRGVPFASHLPFVLEGDTLVAHVARQNPQWRHFDGSDVLVVFSGPHAYVSPRWYHAPAEHVPTWNYVAVHAYGVPELLDAAASLGALDRLVAQEEARFADPWVADAAVRDQLAGAVVAFRIPVTRWEGKLKLSQNRDPSDVSRVAEALATEAPEVARWMRRG